MTTEQIIQTYSDQINRFIYTLKTEVLIPQTAAFAYYAKYVIKQAKADGFYTNLIDTDELAAYMAKKYKDEREEHHE